MEPAPPALIAEHACAPGSDRRLPVCVRALPVHQEAPHTQAAPGRLHRPGNHVTPGTASRLRPGHRHRRLRPAQPSRTDSATSSKNGPERERYSDPDASWGHRSAISTRKGGGFYGYKLHLAACSQTDLPVAWHITTARTHEASQAGRLLGAVKARKFKPETVTLDKGYDIKPVYDACHQAGALPVIPLRKTPAVKQGKHLPPTCEHGVWAFAGTDFKRKLTKWRCPTGNCQPKSHWRKASRLHPADPAREQDGSAICTGAAPPSNGNSVD